MNWDLTHLYKSEEDLEQDIDKIEQRAIEFEKKFKSKVVDLKSKEFLRALDEYEEILESLGRALTYVFLTFATDSSRGDFLAKYQLRGNNIDERLIFFELEFNKYESDKISKIVKRAKEKSFYLKSLAKEKRYQLSLAEERILLKKSLTSSNAFSRLFDEHLSQIKFKFRAKEVGEEVVLSELSNRNRKTRLEASNSLTAGLKPHLNLLAYIFNMIKSDTKVEAELRGYESVEDIRHLSNKISKKSVDSLIKATESSFNLVSSYYRVKRDILNLDRLYDYDRYAPIDSSEDGYSFENSKEIVLKAFREFDESFYEIANRAFKEGWIDAYPKEGKRAGAFSHPATPSTHPYVLLNHTGKRRDLFTLAHELGHAIHQYYSRDVGYLSSDTPLTTAETASVFAEMLVFDYIKSDLKNEELLSLYGSKLEDIFATLYRQIIFTTFERRVHSFDGELKVEDFNRIWIEENRAMFQDSVELRDEYQCWWSYIPHFIHSPFYCYAYSYGQLLVLALYRLYKSKDNKNFKDAYLTFLKSGDSRSPKELISLFGFDIEDEKFWQEGIKEIKSIFLEFKSIAKEHLESKNRLKGSSLDRDRVIDDIINLAR